MWEGQCYQGYARSCSCSRILPKNRTRIRPSASTRTASYYVLFKDVGPFAHFHLTNQPTEPSLFPSSCNGLAIFSTSVVSSPKTPRICPAHLRTRNGQPVRFLPKSRRYLIILRYGLTLIQITQPRQKLEH